MATVSMGVWPSAQTPMALRLRCLPVQDIKVRLPPRLVHCFKLLPLSKHMTSNQEAISLIQGHSTATVASSPQKLHMRRHCAQLMQASSCRAAARQLRHHAPSRTGRLAPGPNAMSRAVAALQHGQFLALMAAARRSVRLCARALQLLQPAKLATQHPVSAMPGRYAAEPLNAAAIC